MRSGVAPVLTRSTAVPAPTRCTAEAGTTPSTAGTAATRSGAAAEPTSSTAERPMTHCTRWHPTVTTTRWTVAPASTSHTCSGRSSRTPRSVAASGSWSQMRRAPPMLQTTATTTPRPTPRSSFTGRLPLGHQLTAPGNAGAVHNSRRVSKVLIIEDDDVIARGMTRHLQTAGFDAISVANGETGIQRLRFERPDVCVLDLMLPGLDGWRVIEQARNEGIGTPIVVVSARGTEHDRVHALELGADDYLVKPFSMRELAARVTAVARRGTRAPDPRRDEEIVIEELRLDPRNVQVYVDGASADVTPTEFRLLYTLAREEGRVLTRDEILQRVWGRRATHRDRTVDVFVRKLREKVDRRASRHTFLQTRYGVGYKLEAEPK